jgi:hypothetical protein
VWRETTGHWICDCLEVGRVEGRARWGYSMHLCKIGRGTVCYSKHQRSALWRGLGIYEWGDSDYTPVGGGHVDSTSIASPTNG